MEIDKQFNWYQLEFRLRKVWIISGLPQDCLLECIRHGSQIWQLSATSPTSRLQPKVMITIVIIKLKLWPAAGLWGQSCGRIKLPSLMSNIWLSIFATYDRFLHDSPCVWLLSIFFLVGNECCVTWCRRRTQIWTFFAALWLCLLS